MTRKTITHQTWTKCIILRHPFYFTTLPNYDSRLKPSGSSRWSQRFSQALGFARLDSVSLLFASYIDDFSSLQYRYVRGWNMRYKCFHLLMDSQPDFYFICPTNPPASLCASRPTFQQRGFVYICLRDLHASWSDPLLLVDFFEDKNESWRFVVEHFCLFWL